MIILTGKSRIRLRYILSLPNKLNNHKDCAHFLQIDITEDACFNGNFIRRLIYLTEPSVWRWHILGQQLPEGTQCQFTTTVSDALTRTILSRLQMSTSCTISSNNSSPVMPATCLSPELIPQGCPCRCSDGFRIDEREDVTDSLICRSKTIIIIHAAMAVQRKAIFTTTKYTQPTTTLYIYDCSYNKYPTHTACMTCMFDVIELSG